MYPFQLKEVHEFQEMVEAHPLLTELYPSLSLEEYKDILQKMIPMNYHQLWVLVNNQIVGISGYWIGNKIWCGKYLELDNVVVAETHRSKGIGKRMTDYLKQVAIQEGCTMLGLDVYTDNFQGIKFYMNEGYIPRGFHMIHRLK